MARRGRPKKNVENKEVVAVDDLKFCLCGCGAEVSSKSKFVVGHDGKASHLLAQVNRGKAEFKDLPQILQDSVVQCKVCKDFMIPSKKSSDVCVLCRTRKANAAKAEVY